MQVSSKLLPQSRVRYTANLETDEVGKFFDQALVRLAKSIKVPGFRAGKAPAEMVKTLIEPDKLREEAYGLAVSDIWQQIASDIASSSSNSKETAQKTIPIQDPEVELVKFELDAEAEIVFSFDIRPTVSLGNWESIKLPKTSGVEEADDKEVAEMIESLARAHAKQTVKLTGAQKGDRLHVSFEGSRKGVRLDKLTGKNFPVILGHANTIPGFDEQLVGLKKGEKKKFTLNFPTDHFDKELAGQLVDFAVEVEEVFDVILPELNDEFATHFGHETTEQLRQAIKEDIANRKNEEIRTTQKAKWLAEFEKIVKTDVPQSLVNAEVMRSRESWQEFLSSRHLNAESWLKDRKITLEQLEADWSKAALSSVKIGLGLAEVARHSGRELKSNEEFQQLLDELVQKAAAKN